MKDIQSLRRDFAKQTLTMENIDHNPFKQFEKWMQDAITSELTDPNCFNLSTVSGDGKPSGRILLLRGLDERGFVFYTNYDSHKSKDLMQNPQAAITFYWAELERQVRIEGLVSKIAAFDSDSYFASRPRESQIGAYTSQQSKIIEGRHILDERFVQFSKQFENKEVPRPENWGGFRLNPEMIEFWQGRPSRLHDRIAFLKKENSWTINRLAP